MRSEKEKMLAGELYDALDPELVGLRGRCRELCREYNRLGEREPEERAAILEELFGYRSDVWIQAPFYCDYGLNIELGEKVYFNFGCVVLDVARVTIGDHVLVGPAVQIYAATHPVEAELRRAGLEFGKPVSVGDDVWIGGGAILLPGVSVGARSVIGAGSVVTKPVPADVFAAGNPCRVLRRLDEK